VTDRLQRYKLTVAYDGTDFFGWQKQEPKGLEPLRTVQGELDKALVQVLRLPKEQIDMLGASRTDSGVHALGQTCHFNAPADFPVERMRPAINSRLPDDIDVRGVEPIHDGFDAIADAKSKQYRYRFFNDVERPLWDRRRVYHEPRPLDVAAMQDAAGRLVGTRDVVGFASSHHGRTSTVRTIFGCQIEEHACPPTPRPPDAAPVSIASQPSREVHAVIVGDGFLYHMVRIIAGTLLDVGKGRFGPERIDDIFATGNRRLAGPTLPAQGLCLEWIAYPDDEARMTDDETAGRDVS
jgi:tRNA pseudouridine38-40 synthase